MTGTPKDPISKADGVRPAAAQETSLGDSAGLAFQFAISVIVCVYVGQWLDTKLGTAPWLLIIGVFFGAVLSFYSMYRKLAVLQARDEAARKARKGGQQ